MKFKNYKAVLPDSFRLFMKLSHKLSQRINQIRKGVIEVCDRRIRQLKTLELLRKEISNILNASSVKINSNSISDFKSVNQDIFNFKNSLDREVMRLMMLPEKKEQISHECDECEITKNLLIKLETVKLCKDSDQNNNDNCMDTGEVLEHLFKITDYFDDEFKNILMDMKFNDRRKSMTKNTQALQDLKALKTGIEETVHELLYSSVGSLRLRNINISEGLEQMIKQLKSLNSKCLSKCGAPCNSCGAEALIQAKNHLEEYRHMGSSDNYVDVRDSILDRIERLSDGIRKYKIAKVFNQTSDCEDGRYEIHASIR